MSTPPGIADYALIGDGHSAALVAGDGSIDWCCMPRLDRASLFGRLLDRDRGGCCRVRPDPGPDPGDPATRRRYLDGTMVLETTFRCAGGEARLLDLFTVHDAEPADPYRQLLRVVEGTAGQVTFVVDVRARLDYGAVRPWLRRHEPGLWSASGGDDAIVVSARTDGGAAVLDVVDRHDLRGRFTVHAGQRARLSIVWYPPEQLDPAPPAQPDADELDRRLDRTVRWWETWNGWSRLTGPFAAGAHRSALTLKALINPSTGAMAAAATTSLPETPGGGRNWDYRFSWIRDSQFAVRSLAELGWTEEADRFRRFIERTAAGSPDELQTMYGLGGERRLTEQQLPLDGYGGARPVRIGNAAAGQLQLDIYGELADLAWRWHRRGRSPDGDYWRFLAGLAGTVVRRWHEPDRGLWELRGEPRHFVHSKVMCWAALDRAIRLAEDGGRPAPLDDWRRERERIRRSVHRHGVDRGRRCFVQAYGAPDVDASLLLLPTVDFVPADHPLMVGTVAAVREDLEEDGLLRRYRNDDGLDGTEGAFIACTFWLAECLADQGDLPAARDAFTRAVATANDLGLFTEEFDTRHGRALGNFPQALTHFSHISAAVALERSGVVRVPMGRPPGT